MSIVLPTLNEREFVRDCLESLAEQDYGNLLEILVADGGSIDGTQDIATGFGEPVRLVHNPRVTAAAALNLGLAEAKGDILVRADAHTLYESDYVSRCVAVLEETGAANVGGVMRPVGTSRFGQAVAAVTTSVVGMGPGKFHYGDEREEVDTVYLGAWRRETLEMIGGWDERRLQWGAEDHELNLRITQSGGRIVLDPSIRSWYFVRATPRALWRQYANYGMGKASTLAKHRTLPTWRPLGPAGLVVVTAVMAVAGGRRTRFVVPIVHAGALAVLARSLSGQPGVEPLRSFGAAEICHWAYGLGFWRGMTRLILRRPFDVRPRSRR